MRGLVVSLMLLASGAPRTVASAARRGSPVAQAVQTTAAPARSTSPSTAAGSSASSRSSAASGPASPSGSADRGRYLVERVAMCVQCHSPRDESGELIGSRLLTGAPVPLTAPFRGASWAVQAPRIAGLPDYTDAEALRLLTQGIARTGRPPMPPMPRFRLEEADASDVIAYLRSLR